MSTTWKALIALALVIPLAAYVIGTLAPSTADDSDRSRPVIIGEVPDDEPAEPQTSPPRDDRDRQPDQPGDRARVDDDDDDDADDDAAGESDGDDDADADDDAPSGNQGGTRPRGDQTDDRGSVGVGDDDRDDGGRSDDEQDDDGDDDGGDEGDDD